MLYILEYKHGEKGCPAFFSADYNTSEYEWDALDPNPDKFIINNTYTCKAKDPFINFDFYGAPTPIVSEEFTKVCDELRVLYRTIPVKIIQKDNMPTSKEYHYFLVKSNIEILDRNLSIFADAVDIYTGEIVYNKIYHPQKINAYDHIKKFVIKSNIELPHLFRGMETLELICTDTFKTVCEAKGLKGVSFIPLDDDYKYDPWGEITEE